MKPLFHLSVPGPHNGQPVMASGETLEHAQAAAIFCHGRGASAADMLLLADKLARPGFAFLVPQAAAHHWYPKRYWEPLEDNRAWLESALAGLDEMVAHLVQAGLPYEKILLLGFSQGACLVAEYAARNPRRWGGVAVLAGAMIGPLEHPRTAGSLEGTPVFMGSSDTDPFIYKEHIQRTAELLESAGAAVDLRFYPNLDHRINLDELHAVQALMETLA